MSSPSSSDTWEIPAPRRETRAEPVQPVSSIVHIDAAGLSDPGKLRTNNEDHFLIVQFGRSLECLETNLPADAIPAHFSDTCYGFAVADGVGGAAGGEVASTLALQTLVRLVLHVPDWIFRPDSDQFLEEIARRAAEYNRQIQLVMKERARDDPSLHGFGTTMTVAWNLGNQLFISHIGDSSAFLYRGNALHKLTREHTLTQSLLDAGAISKTEAGAHFGRHVLTRSLGDQSGSPDPEVSRFALEEGDWLILCTDGLPDMVNRGVLVEVMQTANTAKDLCRSLVDAALAAGGKDNVTVVAARYSFPTS
jgi:protein phosphatase